MYFSTFINVVFNRARVLYVEIEIQKPRTGAPDRKKLRGLAAKWPGGGKRK